VRPRFFQLSIRPASTRAGQRVDVEDGEIGLQSDQLGMPPEDFHADGVEGAEPGHALDDAAHHGADPLLHLARGLVGEGHRQDFGRPGALGGEDMGDAGGQHAGFAGSGARQHQHRAVERDHRLALFGVEVVQVGGRAADARTRRNPARRWRGGC